MALHNIIILFEPRLSILGPLYERSFFTICIQLYALTRIQLFSSYKGNKKLLRSNKVLQHGFRFLSAELELQVIGTSSFVVVQRRWNAEAVGQAEWQLVEHGVQPLEENERMKMRSVSFEGLPSLVIIWMVRTTPFSDPVFNCSANSGRLSFCSVWSIF